MPVWSHSDDRVLLLYFAVFYVVLRCAFVYMLLVAELLAVVRGITFVTDASVGLNIVRDPN